ncbi:MAG: 2-oxo acid dehydrogenase subunit E2 [Deltaproteobacteria bacterium]|nr:2-oxo acid dehydrogenase subunit E2 [Deltaproteobacteria bacterium]
MVTPILVPKLGMTQSDITVVKWLKGDGESLEKGEPVVVIETAKVTYEIETPASGMVFALKKVKDKVKIGETLGVVSDSREEFEAYGKTLKEEPRSEAGGFFDEPEEEWGIRLSFEERMEEGRAVPQAAADLGDRVVLDRIPFIGMRRTIADNLVSSLQTGAQLTVVTEVDMTEVAQFRKEFMLDRPGERITFVDLLVKLLASVLKEFPVMNSTIIQDEIICWGEYHIGVAVALENGLVVPVVRNADQKSLVAVSREIKRLAEKARRNELQPDQYQGGTFTLSSGGNVDVDFMTPIINPPQNAIIGIGKIAPKPAVYRNELAIRTMTHLCLTHDHRVIDGVPAAGFLGRLKRVIEQPELFRRILK